jgi:hypothetical protein
MIPALVDERGHAAPADVIEPASTSGYPSAARSFTSGEKSSFPLNQGLTVCRSEEATSVRCSAISDRTCADTTSWFTTSSSDGALGMATSAQARVAITGSEAATARQCHPPRVPLFESFDDFCSSVRTRLSALFGAAALVAVAGHLGGTLVWGADFLRP